MIHAIALATVLLGSDQVFKDQASFPLGDRTAVVQPGMRLRINGGQYKLDYDVRLVASDTVLLKFSFDGDGTLTPSPIELRGDWRATGYRTVHVHQEGSTVASGDLRRHGSARFGSGRP